jgi:hypothetical protein
LEAIRELKLLGVGVYFEKENINTATMSGEMMTALFAAFAQAESESISGNMRLGIQMRMQNGTFVPSHQPFGFRLTAKQIVINPLQARFVHEIFSAYLSGWNTKEIAAYLNELQPKYPELCGRNWTFQAISRILKNEKYIGNSLWQKTYRTDTFPRKELSNHGERKQYYAHCTHPSIIDEDTYQRTQKLIAQRKFIKAPINSENVSPFQKMIYCGHCGCHLRKKRVGQQMYRNCRIHDMNRADCTLTPIPEKEVKNAFLRLYYKLMYSSF